METGGTEALRSAAANWSLAGDRQLLQLLQNIHQKIMTRCQETNNKLEEMVVALDSASVSLQNVNNRFMSLSNSQFIESRVYEDDADVADVTSSKKPALGVEPSKLSELSSLSLALQTVERLHEPVTILRDRESDSDSEDDDMQSTILKPTDMYAERPLPHIIGSYNWKDKWHAGLVLEDSDTESSTSKPGNKQSDEYSESESDLEDKQTDTLGVPQRSYIGSATSSEPSEQDTMPAPAKPSQADIAAELARRLGGGKIPDPSPNMETDIQTPVTRKVYKPQAATTGTIFSDEPPPLDTTQESDFETYSNEEDDIFAEINRNAPYSDKNKAQNTRVDIFADLHVEESGANVYDDGDQNRMAQGDVFDDFSKASVFNKPKPQSDKQSSTLFGDEEGSELFAEKSQIQPPAKPKDVEIERSSVKKPAGAISLFGSNKGTESIGAAILNRNRRKSSTSSEETNKSDSENDKKRFNDNFPVSKPTVKGKTDVNTNGNATIEPVDKGITNEEDVRAKEPDIFDHLFARSEKAQKEAEKSQKNKETTKNFDLFSDNIFDDINDIFSSNVVIKKSAKDVKNNKSKSKSLFHDVDDLFADIGVEKTETVVVNNAKKSTSIFDSDGDLFTQKNVENESAAKMSQYENDSKNPKSLDNIDIFSGNTQSTSDKLDTIGTKLIENEQKTIHISENDDDGLFFSKTSSNDEGKYIEQHNELNTQKIRKKNYLFDEDEDDDDIFSAIKAPKLNKTEGNETNVPESNQVRPENEDLPHNQTHEKIHKKHNNNFDSLQTNPKLTDKFSKIQDISNSMKFQSVQISTDKDCLLTDNAPEEETVKSPSLFDAHDEIDNLFVGPKESPKSTEKGNLKSETTLHLSNDCSVVNNKNVPENVNACANNEKRSLFDKDNDSEGLFLKTANEAKTQQKKRNIAKDISSQDQNDNSVQDKAKLLEERVTISKPDFINQDKENKKSEIQSVNVDDRKSIIDNAQINLDSNKNLEHDRSFSAPSNEEKPDIFTDLFLDQPPPVFEKPLKAKKSINVNALFDDDSDDEALFFKKNDNFSDEKPEDITPIKTEPLLTIFHDEPPAIDTDFTQKFGTTTNRTATEVYKALPEQPIESVKEQPEVSQSNKYNLDGFTQSKEEEKQKSVGKLKPMSFNINVSTLLPGASPKKQIKINKNNEENSAKSAPESLTEEVKPTLVKSVSFEGDPESPILDNKISKERAKIQVKRRPSTRRARKEAVRKSVIDFGDETDGSSDRNGVRGDDNINNQKQVENNCTQCEIKVMETSKDRIDVASEEVSEHIKTLSVETPNDVAKVFRDISDKSKDEQNVAKKNTEDINIFTDDQHLSATPIENSEISANIDDIPVMSHEILNEILKENKVTKDNPNTEVLNINEDDVYIFRDPNILKTMSENIQNADHSKPDTGVKTLGDVAVQKTNENKKETTEGIKSENLNTIFNMDTDGMSTSCETKSNEASIKDIFSGSDTVLPKTSKKSLFDDLSDDENLFGGIKRDKTQITATKNVFSNTYSEDELFTSKTGSRKKDVLTKPVEAKSDKKLVEVKKSLFGDDDDDDDDLFGATKKTSLENKEKSQQKPPDSFVEERYKTNHQVFEDPLSLLGAEDEF